MSVSPCIFSEKTGHAPEMAAAAGVVLGMIVVKEEEKKEEEEGREDSYHLHRKA
jgi:hypothetical protein